MTREICPGNIGVGLDFLRDLSRSGDTEPQDYYIDSRRLVPTLSKSLGYMGWAPQALLPLACSVIQSVIPQLGMSWAWLA